MRFTRERACCATCEYWLGERKIDVSAASIETPTYSKGRCESNDSSFSLHDTFYSLTCPDWMKWKALK